MHRKSFINRVALTVILGLLIADGIYLTWKEKNREEKEPPTWSYYTLEADTTLNLKMPMTVWDVWGCITTKEDSTLGDSMAMTPLLYREKCLTDTLQIHRYKGIYHPLYNQLDLKEVYGVAFNDTTHALDGKVTYLSTGITTPAKRRAYIEVKCGMPMTLWLNGDTLTRADIQGLHIYKVQLKEGENRLTVKVQTTGDDHAFEAQLCDERNIARLFAEGQSGNIIYPLIYSDIEVIMLTNAHQNVVDEPAILEMYDVHGERIDSFALKKDSITYHVPALEKDVSYMCHLTMAGTTVRQPVLCGRADDAYTKFSALRQTLPDSHPRAMEIDQVLHRLHFLLNHPTRSGDWWWQFKISPLSYQLEYLFSHLNCKPGEEKGEENVQLMTYRSKLDGGVQRYLLVTPNHLSKEEKLPLVVIMRPNIDNHHHFFAAPQLARQWAVNIAQAQANRHRYIVMMPEARIYHSEDLTPMAEAEMKQAIEEVKSLYPVDEERIYLHANCSGGYRALRMATQNPEMFAAIGLYAPVYQIEHPHEWAKKRAPKRFMKNLKETPMMIHGDPFDTHSPFQLYKELVTDCQKLDIPMELSIKRNSGKFYNVVVVGEEAFDYFEGKRKMPTKHKRYARPKTDAVIADLYAEPFVYVYHAADTTTSYREAVDSIRREYEDYLFTTLPLLPDTAVTDRVLHEKNLFLIGNRFSQKELSEWAKMIPDKENKECISMRLYESPFTKGKKVVLYKASHGKMLKHLIHYPWKDGLRKEIIKPL